MKQVIVLDNGARVEIHDSNVKIFTKDGKLKYTYSGGRNKGIEHFFLMGDAQRKEVEEWLKTAKELTKKQKKFLEVVSEATKTIDYDYKIATIEPSFDDDGNIFYEKGEKVAIGIQLSDWNEKGEKFFCDTEWISELASLEELFLWYAWRIATGKWTIEYVCDNSSTAGNYWNSPSAIKDIELSGKRLVGGFYDGIGNTCKIVRHGKYFALVGGYHSCLGTYYPVADFALYNCSNYISNNAVGVLLLKCNKVR